MSDCRICAGVGSFVLRSHRWDAAGGRMVPFVNGPFPCRACSPAKVDVQRALLRLRDDRATDDRLYR